MPRRLRSPSFPFISLSEAIHRARELYEAERRNPVHADVAVAHWGYGSKSSSGLRILAALKHFGLLESTRGELRLTDRAHQILVREAGSPERNDLLVRAALSPPLFDCLWQRYGAELPSDRSLRSYLELELKVNGNAVEGLLRSFRETLVTAGLVPGGSQEETRPALLQTGLVAPAELTLSFPLGDTRGELKILRKVRPEEAETLRRLFEIWLDQITERPDVSAARTSPPSGSGT